MNNRVILLLPTSTSAFRQTAVINSANLQGLNTFVIADTVEGVPTEWAIRVTPQIGDAGVLERGFTSSTQADDRMRKLANKYF